MKNLEITFGLIVAVLGLITAFKWKELSGLKKILSIVSMVAGTLFSGITAYNTYMDKKIESHYGDINSGSYTNVKMLQIGFGGTRIQYAGPDGAVFVIGKEKAPGIELFLKNGKLVINAVCRDLSGKVIAKIIQNEWTLYSNDYEYNNDDNAFELVIKGEQQAIFQIDLQKDVVHVAGLFVDESADGFFICENPKGDDALIITMDKNSPKGQFVPIKPIFKYPRERYLGIRVK
jgi:hypothetical protein